MSVSLLCRGLRHTVSPPNMRMLSPSQKFQVSIKGHGQVKTI